MKPTALDPAARQVLAEDMGTRVRRALAVHIPYHLVTTLLVAHTFWDSPANRTALIIWIAAQPALTALVVLSAIGGPMVGAHWQRIGRWMAVINQAAMPWVVGEAGGTLDGGLVIVIVAMMATLTVALRTLATSELDRQALWRIAFVAGSAATALLVQGNRVAAVITVAATALLSIEFSFGRNRIIKILSWAKSRNLVSLSDPLTGLLNRGGFLELVDAASNTVDGGAVAMIDLDRFKVINDAYGHATGDQVLREVATRFEASLPEARVGRLGGDEFGVLFPPGTTVEGASESITASLAAVESPIKTGLATVRVRSSAGVAPICPGVDTELLMAQADVSMYESKRRGGRRVTAFVDLLSRPIESAKLEQRIRAAIDSGEIDFDVQPIVSAHGRHPVTAELLARWRQPDGTTIPPSVFLPIIRRAGLSTELLVCALRAAGALFHRWSGDPELSRLGININVEADSLESGFVELLETHIGSEFHTRFGIELVESAIVDLSTDAAAILSHLGQSGIRVFLDDFGTGQSSLSQLRDLPITNVKVDKSFVTGIDHDKVKQEFLRIIVEISTALSITVVAEGVESPEEWACLQSFEIRAVQGFFLAEPVPMAECEPVLQALFAASPWTDADLKKMSDNPQVDRRQRRYRDLGWDVDLSVAVAQGGPWREPPQ